MHFCKSTRCNSKTNWLKMWTKSVKSESVQFFLNFYSLPRTGSQNDTRRQNRRRSRRMYERAKKKLHKAYSDTARAVKSSSSAVWHRLGDGAACRKMCGFHCEFSSTTSCLCRNSIVWNTWNYQTTQKPMKPLNINFQRNIFVHFIFYPFSTFSLYVYE